MTEFVGIAGGFALAFFVLISGMIFDFMINSFIPAATTALNTTARSLNTTNSPSPKMVFWWAIIGALFVEALEMFFFGYFGGLELALGQLIGVVFIFIFLGGLLSEITPGVPSSMLISLISVFIGAIKGENS